MRNPIDGTESTRFPYWKTRLPSHFAIQIGTVHIRIEIHSLRSWQEQSPSQFTFACFPLQLFLKITQCCRCDLHLNNNFTCHYAVENSWPQLGLEKKALDDAINFGEIISQTTWFRNKQTKTQTNFFLSAPVKQLTRPHTTVYKLFARIGLFPYWSGSCFAHNRLSRELFTITPVCYALRNWFATDYLESYENSVFAQHKWLLDFRLEISLCFSSIQNGG